MGLPGELERKDSRLRLFFEERFPNRAAIKKQVCELAHESQTVRPSGDKPGDVRWGTLATAIDYRIKLCFLADQEIFYRADGGRYGTGLLEAPLLAIEDTASPYGFRSLVAASGAQVLVYAGLLAREQARDLSVRVLEAARLVTHRDRKLPRAKEDELCRLCYAMALLDEIAPPRELTPGALLAGLPKNATADDLLALADDESVDDLRAMAWLFYETQRRLLRGKETLIGWFVEGERHVHADPDLIVDGCMIEIKTAVDPRHIKKPSWPWQLLAYALLDYSDRYKLESVALYLPRQGLLVDWPLDEYASMLAGRDVSVAQARRDLQRALAPA
jgi:hypothetical protein